MVAVVMAIGSNGKLEGPKCTHQPDQTERVRLSIIRIIHYSCILSIGGIIIFVYVCFGIALLFYAILRLLVSIVLYFRAQNSCLGPSAYLLIYSKCPATHTPRRTMNISLSSVHSLCVCACTLAVHFFFFTRFTPFRIGKDSFYFFFNSNTCSFAIVFAYHLCRGFVATVYASLFFQSSFPCLFHSFFIYFT